MRATEHYREAEDALRIIASNEANDEGRQDRSDVIAIAGVHATLALAAATALQSYARVDDTASDQELDDWQTTAGGEW